MSDLFKSFYMPGPLLTGNTSDAFCITADERQRTTLGLAEHNFLPLLVLQIPVACKSCPCGHRFAKTVAESAKKGMSLI